MTVGEYSGIVWLWGYVMKGINVFDPWGPLYVGVYIAFIVLFMLQFAAGMTNETSGGILTVDTVVGIAGGVLAVIAAVALLYQAVGVVGTILSPVFVLFPVACYTSLFLWKPQASPMEGLSSADPGPDPSIDPTTVHISEESMPNVQNISV
jgi:hypothetical protein